MSTPVKQAASSLQIYRRLLSYVKNYWLVFMLGIIGTILSSGTDASITWFLKPVLDKGFIAKDPGFIRWLPVMMLVAFLVRGIAGFMSNYFMTSVGRNVVLQFRREIFARFLQLPADFYDNSSAGQLLSTLTFNVDQVAKAATDSLVTLVQEGFFVLGLLCVMLMISWQCTALFLLTAPIIASVARYCSSRMRKLSRYVQEGMGDLTHVAEEALEGYQVIRSFAGQAYETNKFEKIIQRNRSRELRLAAINSLATGLTQQVLAIVIAITIYLATLKTSAVTAGGFASLLAAMIAILKPMKSLSTISSTIQRGIAAAESIFKLIDQPIEIDQGTQSLTHAKGAITFKNVSFSYRKTQQSILHQLNFSVAAGQKIAIVGRSGSGKSTLVNLLPRFYDNYEGTIYLDDIDTRTLRLSDLREQFTLVSQNVILFNDTIAHNIAYGRFNSTSEAEIVQAAAAANAMEFIDNLPAGLQTQVGENGVLLSGGQRQRIAIARALLKNAPILIFDEATSALDTESERYIQTALNRLMTNRTTFIIAHRLSTIENADHIIVLDKGHIIESGTHQALMQHNAHYAKLHKLQFQTLDS